MQYNNLTSEQRQLVNSRINVVLGYFSRRFIENFYPWQKKFVFDFFTNAILSENDSFNSFSICGAYGTGKTTIGSFILVAHLLYCKLFHEDQSFNSVVISGSETQLQNVLWRELGLILSKNYLDNTFDRYVKKCDHKTDKRFFIQARVANPDNVHTLAGCHGGNLLVVIDETTTLPACVIEKIMTFFTNTRGMLLMLGNPVNKGCYFQKVVDGTCDFWHRYRITRFDCSGASGDAYAERVRDEYGEESDEYRVNVLGQYGLTDAEAFFPAYIVDNAFCRSPTFSRGALIMGVDVASGESADFSTVVLRNLNNVFRITRKKIMLPDFKLLLLDMIAEYRPVMLFIDEIGIGCGLYADLRQICASSSTRIIGVNGARSPTDQIRFTNYRAQLYHSLKDWLRVGNCLPDLEHMNILKQELYCVRAFSSPRNGKLQIEAKGSHKSPDLVDALAYTFGVESRLVKPEETVNYKQHSTRIVQRY